MLSVVLSNTSLFICMKSLVGKVQINTVLEVCLKLTAVLLISKSLSLNVTINWRHGRRRQEQSGTQPGLSVCQMNSLSGKGHLIKNRKLIEHGSAAWRSKCMSNLACFCYLMINTFLSSSGTIDQITCPTRSEETADSFSLLLIILGISL